MADTALPTGQAYSRAHIAAHFTWAGLSTQAWSAAKYLVPKTWHSTPLPTPAKPGVTTLTTLAAYVAPGDAASLRIQVVMLEREITAQLWLRHYLIAAGNQPETLATLSPKFADSLSQYVMDGQALVGRIAARIHGNLLFLVAGSCPLATYGQFAELFGLCVASFQPTSTPTHGIEPRSKGAVGKVVGFEYPGSWKSREVPALDGKLATDLISITGGQPTGIMRVKTCSKDQVTRMELQIEDALHEFASAGVIPGELMVNKGLAAVGPRFHSGFLQVFAAKTSAGVAQELWLVVAEDEDYYITISLLTPDRRQHFLIWAWNRTAFDIVTESLV